MPNRRAISEVEFTNLSFEEFGMRKDDIVHDLIRHQIHGKIIMIKIKKHGPSCGDMLYRKSKRKRGKKKERSSTRGYVPRMYISACIHGATKKASPGGRRIVRVKTGKLYGAPWQKGVPTYFHEKHAQANQSVGTVRRSPPWMPDSPWRNYALPRNATTA